MAVGWVLRYAAKVRKDPAASLVGWEEDAAAAAPARRRPESAARHAQR
jgi:uncharacterized ion transporter superfamily protein YfcC